ncbi:hypothetical protein Bbelb_114750 [Branchiostoma belcheri]|nr:hypothetical protein Bbelb_114750 [Branchiostoma belcheri]
MTCCGLSLPPRPVRARVCVVRDAVRGRVSTPGQAHWSNKCNVRSSVVTLTEPASGPDGLEFESQLAVSHQTCQCVTGKGCAKGPSPAYLNYRYGEVSPRGLSGPRTLYGQSNSPGLDSPLAVIYVYTSGRRTSSCGPENELSWIPGLSFFPRTIQEWNELGSGVTEAGSLAQFKTGLARTSPLH